MAETTLRGNPIHTAGDLPAIGSSPSFTVTKGDLQNLTNDDLKGSKVVLNIFPSIDTPVCASSVRTFNERAAALDNTKIVCVSAGSTAIEVTTSEGQLPSCSGVHSTPRSSDAKRPKSCEPKFWPPPTRRRVPS